MRVGQAVRANGTRGIIVRVGDELNDYQVFFPETGTIHFVAAEDIQEISIDLKYVRSGKIPAIKVLRELTGLGLKEAKDLAEAIAEGCESTGYHARDLLLQQKDAIINALRDEVAEKDARINVLNVDNIRLRARVNKLLDTLTPDQLRALIADNL